MTSLASSLLEQDRTMFQEKNTISKDEVIKLIIKTSKQTFNILSQSDAKFHNIAKQICEFAGWELSKIRFLLDGDHLQHSLTLIENDVQDGCVIEAFEELVGGKGPSESEVREMIDACDSNPEDEVESEEELDQLPLPEAHYKLYEDLKCQLKDGRLSLDDSNYLDNKLHLLLKTNDLEPYEIIRLVNVYSCWEQHQIWKKETEQTSSSRSKTKSCQKPSKKKAQLKRTVLDRSPEMSHYDDETTPKKRRKLLETFGLSTPSPLSKMSSIKEIDMKRMSVAVHLWAERKMGGVEYLQTNRLNDEHFEDIMKFTGPGSKWKLIKGWTIKQFKSLWRNTSRGKQYHRGHHKTGFENEMQVHLPRDPYCPYGYCSTGVMCPLDQDLIVLTPQKGFDLNSDNQKTFSSRKLFHDKDEEKGANPKSEVSSDINVPPVLEAFPNTVDGENDLIGMENEPNIDPLGSSGINLVEEKEQKGNNSAYQIKNKEFEEPTFVCGNCGKVFQTFFGLERHNADKHSESKLSKIESTCQICLKKVVYLDRHMKSKHSQLQKPTVCDVCLKEINSNMLKHRQICIKCIYCDYKNTKKARLISHIKKCEQNHEGNVIGTFNEEPLDLRSPLKKSIIDENQNIRPEIQTLRRDLLIKVNTGQVMCTEAVDIGSDSAPSPEAAVKQFDVSEMNSNVNNEILEKGRQEFPFDHGKTDEDYFSEIDIDDEDVYTIERRKIKDSLELQLRAVDDMENTEIEGDNMIVEKFAEFMRNKRHKGSKEEGFSKQTEPTTINMYSKVVRNDILPSFHKLVSPFDSRWLIDCVTSKICTFEGEERVHVNPQEPIYMTSRILQQALMNTTSQKKRVISTFIQLMDFIELHFTLKLNTHGVDVLNKVLTYHNGVKSFIKATSQWKKSKDEENAAYEKNKLIKGYQNPNKDAEVLEKYKQYIKSEERVLKITELLSYSYEDSEIPSAAMMTEFGITVMEEIVACTGCRPKVARHFNMGAFIDGKPGFNPHNIVGEEATIEEEVDGEQILRRVNPNLPPKGKACVHQIRSKSAICSEKCEKQCVPEGFNFWVTWDKTQSTNGPYFLHLPTPIKNLMDRYDIIRSSFFKERRPKFGVNDDWLEDEETPLFLNSACNSFPSLDLKKLSQAFGIDITAYDFRKIVSTWAISHKSQEIRAAEEEALQHSLQVAKERYMQNKAVRPQTLVQTYAREENLFPKTFTEQFKKDSRNVDLVIEERQERRAIARYSKLIKQKDTTKKHRFDNRPLGPRNNILESDRREFSEIMEDLTGSKLEALSSLKPNGWRDVIVRNVHSAKGTSGEQIRKLWVKLYRGDLLYGIRDERKKAKECNWPVRKQNPGRRDRNSWIAHALRKSCLAVQKFDDKKSENTESNL